MLSGPILPILLKLSIPLVLSSIMGILFHAADMIIVGKFVSDDAFAAVSSTGTPRAVLVGFISNLTLGVDVCVAHAFGSRDGKRIEKAVHTAMTFGLIAGILMSVISVVFTDVMLRFINVPESIFKEASTYMKITSLGTFASCLYQYAASIMRIKGDTKRPAFYAVCAGAVNVAFNLIFVLGFGMGVDGVALATFISNVFPAILALRAIMNEKDVSQLVLKKLRIDPDLLKDILRIGIPATIRVFFFTIATFFVDSAMNSFGSEIIISGHSAGANIESFIRLIPNVVSLSAVVIIGQCYGAKNYKRMVTALGCGILTICCAGIVFGVGTLLIADKLLGIYISSPDAIAYGVTRLATISIFAFLDYIADTFAATMQNCKHSITPTVISLLCVCVVRSAWAITVSNLNLSYTVLIICYPVSYILSLIVMGIANMIILRKVKCKFASNNESETV